MDNLTYYYPRDAAGNLTANTLRHVKDAVSSIAYQSNLDNMPDDNYTYGTYKKNAGTIALKLAFINRALNTSASITHTFTLKYNLSREIFTDVKLVFDDEN